MPRFEEMYIACYKTFNTLPHKLAGEHGDPGGDQMYPMIDGLYGRRPAMTLLKDSIEARHMFALYLPGYKSEVHVAADPSQWPKRKFNRGVAGANPAQVWEFLERIKAGKSIRGGLLGRLGFK